MIIAVDFDGTIVTQENGYADLKTPLRFMSGAKEGLAALKAAGHTLILYSARSCVGLCVDWKDHSLWAHDPVFNQERWLASVDLNQARRKQMLKFCEKELPGVFACEWLGAGKPSGVDLFIDDRATCGGTIGIDWEAIMESWGEG